MDFSKVQGCSDAFLLQSVVVYFLWFYRDEVRELSAYKPNRGLSLEIFSSCEEQIRFHLDAELLYVLEGTLCIHQGEHLMTLPREGITIVNPNVSYRMEREGDALYIRLGIPTQLVAELTRNDVKYLRRICSPRLTIHTAQTEGSTLPLELTLEPNEICFVRIRNVG